VGELTQDDRRNLLRLARAALRQKLCGDNSVEDTLESTTITAGLAEPRGAFVTLKQRTAKGEALRGCIGSMTSRVPLYRNVIELACKSALEDPRFPPLVAADLVGTRIEISALTPMHDITDPREIEIGRHGVQMRLGAAGAVFLPQVAVEQRWNVEKLLQQLARKAGRKEDDWRDARLSVFEAEVFGEPKSED